MSCALAEPLAHAYPGPRRPFFLIPGGLTAGCSRRSSFAPPGTVTVTDWGDAVTAMVSVARVMGQCETDFELPSIQPQPPHPGECSRFRAGSVHGDGADAPASPRPVGAALVGGASCAGRRRASATSGGAIITATEARGGRCCLCD